jgi:hypothetical protein
MDDRFKNFWALIASIIGAVLLAHQLAQAYTGNRTLVTGLLITISLIAIGAGMWNYAFAKSTVDRFPRYSFHRLAKLALVFIFVSTMLTGVYILTILKVVADCCGFVATQTTQPPTPTLAPPSATPPTVEPTATQITLTGSPINWIPKFDDIPDEMRLLESGINSNEDVAGSYPDPIEFLRTLEEWGRIESYYQIYSQESRCTSKSGLYEINVTVVSFKTASGAEVSREYYMTDEKHDNTTSQETTNLVGENAHLIEWSKSSDCNPPDQVLYESVAFRRYNAVVYVDVGSFANVNSTNDMQVLAIRLAQVQDQKLIEIAP